VLDFSGKEKCLVTDKRVYFASSDATFLYKVGDVLPPGTILSDAISAVFRKSLPENRSLFLERRFLGKDYLAGLFFPKDAKKNTKCPCLH